jgi:hypothetical protein
MNAFRIKTAFDFVKNFSFLPRFKLWMLAIVLFVDGGLGF